MGIASFVDRHSGAILAGFTAWCLLAACLGWGWVRTAGSIGVTLVGISAAMNLLPTRHLLVMLVLSLVGLVATVASGLVQ